MALCVDCGHPLLASHDGSLQPGKAMPWLTMVAGTAFLASATVLFHVLPSSSTAAYLMPSMNSIHVHHSTPLVVRDHLNVPNLQVVTLVAEPSVAPISSTHSNTQIMGTSIPTTQRLRAPALWSALAFLVTAVISWIHRRKFKAMPMAMLTIGHPTRPETVSKCLENECLYFGQYVYARCLEDPAAYPFVPCETLQDVADLYLYRFEESINCDALPEMCAELRLESQKVDVDDDMYFAMVTAKLQPLVEEYFIDGWNNRDMIQRNRARFLELQDLYGTAEDDLCPVDKDVIQDIDESCWDFVSFTKGLALVNFTAGYCSGCERLEAIFQPAAEILHERGLATSFRVNGPDNPGLLSRFNVTKFPCLKLFRKGKEIGEFRPKRNCLSSCVVNFVQSSRFSQVTTRVPQEVVHHNVECLDQDEPVSPATSSDPAWQTKLQAWGIDRIQDIEEDRQAVLMRERYRALGLPVGTVAPSKAVGRLQLERRPRIIFLGGGMGAGKSTVVRALSRTPFWKQAGQHIVTIEADHFKLLDPLFTQLVKIGINNAAEVVHGTSTATAEELLLDALNLGRDIVLDGTMSWSPFIMQTLQMVRDIHEYQYRRGPGYQEGDDGVVTEKYWVCTERREDPGLPYIVEMVGVTVQPEVAVQRGIVRQITTGRDVPVTGQLWSHKMYSAHFEQYIDHFDAAVLMDNNGGAQAIPIAVKGESIVHSTASGNFEVLDEAAFQNFLKKQHINPEASGLWYLYTGDQLNDN